MGLFGKKENVELQVTGMTCGSCVASVTKALESVAGVKAVDVDVTGSAKVVVKQGTSRAALVAAVDAAGFDAS